MQELLIAVVVGFAAGALGAIVVLDSKTAGAIKTIKAMREMIENVEKMAMNNTDAVVKLTKSISLLKHVGELIADDQSKTKVQIWESLNTLWHEVDKLKGAPVPAPDQKPEDEPKPEKKPAEEPKPEQKKNRAKKKPAEGEGND